MSPFEESQGRVAGSRCENIRYILMSLMCMIGITAILKILRGTNSFFAWKTFRALNEYRSQ